MRILTLVVVLVCSAGSAFAQTTEVLSREVRLGTFTTASFLVPADSVLSQVVVDTDMARTDLISPDTDIRYMVQTSDDDGQTWRNYAGGRYVGCNCPGRNGEPQKQPGVEVPLSEFRGLRIRMMLDIPTSTRTGAKVTLR